MRISFSGFGKADRGDIRINDLTIICGPNGSGKTYASYAVYGCVSDFSDFLDFKFEEDTIRSIASGRPVELNVSEIVSRMPSIIGSAGDAFKDRLDRFFNAPDGFFFRLRVSFPSGARRDSTASGI